MIRIGKLKFHEEFEELSLILGKFNDGLRVLDLGCGNWRFFELVKHIYKWDFYYLGVDNQDYCPKYANNIVLGDLLAYYWKFNLIILSWIFTNNCGLNNDTINKISKQLEPGGYIYINMWNYWWDLYRVNDEKAVLAFANKLIDGATRVKLYKKEKNDGYNINMVIEKEK